jgi:tetratricopeptide (TPR) repeat protein
MYLTGGRTGSTKSIGFILFFTTVLLYSIGTGTSTAASLLGADEVISQIDSSLGGEKQKQGETGESKADALMNDIAKFKAGRMSMPADDAADVWLKLYDRFWMLPQAELMKAQEINRGRPGGGNKLSATALISALPAPTAWDTLKKRVVGRSAAGKGPQDTVLRILAYYLTKDKKNIDKSLAELKTTAAMSGGRAQYMLDTLRLNIPALSAGKGEKGVVDSFEAYLQSLQVERPEGLLTVNVPDLVALAGEKRAASLILKAIAVPGLTLRVPAGKQTLELTKQLVLSNATRLIEPQWQLVTSIDDLKLYEALAMRFPDKEKKTEQASAGFQDPKEARYDFGRMDEGKRRAKIFYTMGLIAAHRVKDAIELAKGMEADDITSRDFDKIWQSFEKIRYAPELTQFCSGVLSDRPEFPLWADCGVVASSPKARQKLIDIVEAAGNKPDLGLGARARIKERNVEVLLAMDRTDDAVKVLGRIVRIDAGKESQAEQQAIAQVKYRMIARMCALGKLLGRSDMVRQSAELSLAMIKDFGNGLASNAWYNAWNGTGDGSAVNSVIDTLLDSGEYALAEKIGVAMMRASLKSPQIDSLPNKREMVAATGMLTGMLTSLAEVYDRAGRPEDVINLLERSPWWGASDLIMVAEGAPKLAPLAAKALHHAGRDAEAVEILKGHLYGYPGDDNAYRVLVDISGSSLIPWLDELYERDRFEERPLIWKAHLLKQQGKLEEAEAAARKAIKIDPTDGEQKAGDRGRAYVVLAEILKARGRQDDAAFFERVVAAIRIAEEGDRYTNAGLLRKSLSYYEKAADSFADAYCVQWRMAERLSAMGDHDGARKHYEIAFERMPEQFGEVANFCFGCEGVFTHQQSQSVAEEVLTRLEKTAGQKPQVQFLLGQLRESQGRKIEAYRYYRKAAEIDPDYLDAWKAAYDLRSDVFLQQDEMDEIALHIIRQDPLLRHSYLNIDEVFDQKGLWSVYEQASKRQVLIPDHLLTLSASKKELDAMLKKYGTPEEYIEAKREGYVERRKILEPGDTVAKNQLVRSMIQYLMSSSVGM